MGLAWFSDVDIGYSCKSVNCCRTLVQYNVTSRSGFTELVSSLLTPHSIPSMLKATILSLATIVSTVLAGSVKITSPKPGNVWEIGQEVDIYWYALLQYWNPCKKRFLSQLTFLGFFFFFFPFLLILGTKPLLEANLYLFCWHLDLHKLLTSIWS